MRQILSWFNSFFSAPPSLPTRRDIQYIELGEDGVRADSFVNDLSGLGGLYDKGQSGEPILDRPRLVETQLDMLCQNCGIAQRIVDKPPETATANGWFVRDPTRDANPFADEDRRLNIWARVCEAQKAGRKYGNGYLFMACEEEIDAGETWTSWQRRPLDLNRVIRVVNLVDLDTLNCVAATWDGATGSPNFRKPRTYIVNGQVAGTDLVGVEVHWTRILRFSGVILPPRVQLQNRGRDLSVLQNCLDSLRSVVTTGQAGANYVQEMGVPVLKSPHLIANSSNEKRAAYDAMLLLMAKTRSILNMILLSSDEVLERQSPNISGFKDLDDAARARLCADSGIPMTILFGAEPGGLSTDDQSGRINWYSEIQNLQTTRLAPQLHRLYTVLYSQKQGPTDGGIPEHWEIVFNPLEQTSQRENLETQKLAAEVDQLNIANGIYTAQHVARSRFGPRGWRAELLPVEGTNPETPATSPATAPTAPVATAPVKADAAMVSGGTNLPLKPEILRGDVRRGISPEGKAWAVIMPGEYGEITGTRGLDGEPVDYLLGSGPRGLAFVAELLAPGESEDTPELDEYKVVLGCSALADAQALLDGAYGAAVTWGEVYPVAEDQLLMWLQTRRNSRTADAADLVPPENIRAAFKRGYDWYKAGHGASVAPATATWARRLATGSAITAPRLKKLRSWHSRFGEVEGYASGDPTSRQVAQHLWGGPEAPAWADNVISQLEKR